MTFNMTKTINLFRYLIWLLMIVILLAMPVAGIAATLQPEQFGPSNYMPLLNKNECYGTRPSDIPFGLQFYGGVGDSLSYGNQLRLSNSSWARDSIYWNQIEPENVEPAQYKWAITDQMVRSYQPNCLNLIATIEFTPDWAKTAHVRGPFKNELLPEFIQFVGALVERYDGDGNQDAPGSPIVNYWEFYNEPDSGPSPLGDGWGFSGARYATMLEAAYPVVKSANSNAKVVMGGIAYSNFTTDGGIFVPEFMDNVLDAGGGEYFDLMNFHFYPFPATRRKWTQSDSSGLIEKIQNIKEKLAAHNLTKDIVITEMSWHSNSLNGFSSNQEYQARHVTQLFTQALSADIKIAIWWTFLSPPGYGYDTALLTSNYDTKLAFEAYQEAVKRLGSATDIEVVVAATETNDLEVYQSRMANTNKVQYIAWLNPIAPFSAADEPAFNLTVDQTENWQATGTKATIYSKNGTLLQTITDGADGATDNKVTITVGRSPIYIEIN